MKKVSLTLLSGAVVLMSACSKYNAQNDLSTIKYGATTTLANGTIRSFVKLDAGGTPTSIGLKFSETAITGLPADSTKSWEYPVELPVEAKITGFDHLEVDWNPVGHEPKPIYGLPHFDFHYYRITKQDQQMVIPGPDTITVPKQYIPQDYKSGVIAVPDMGVHWSDILAPEFHRQKFTDAFIYGFYHGQLTFLEPMITQSYILTKPDIKMTIKQPSAFQKSGYYPLVSHLYYDSSTQEFVLALEGLQYKAAN